MPTIAALLLLASALPNAPTATTPGTAASQPLRDGYEVTVTIMPKVQRKSSQSFAFSGTGTLNPKGGHHASNDCSIDQRGTDTFPIPAPWLVSTVSTVVTSGNCGSRVEGTSGAGTSTAGVQWHLLGCGDDHLMGIPLCRGRGWLHYDAYVAAYKIDVLDLQPDKQVRTSATETAYIVNYSTPIPSDCTIVAWQYNVHVKRIAGGIVVREVNIIDNAHPNLSGIQTTQNPTTGEVTVDVVHWVDPTMPTTSPQPNPA